ncbi:glucosidase 2 subunit beta [Anaeramoeba flamelloides]|nr:glucosidase 2 subunit beta [Anaeramoeba flamelloides]
MNLFWVFLLLIIFVDLSLQNLELPVRGASPKLNEKYSKIKNQEFFKCDNGLNEYPISFINDNYCDCEDGSDEPGTSACIEMTFYCSNEGYVPEIIPSSRVNDGICDCSDGSDEWMSPNKCQNLSKEKKVRLDKQMEEEITIRREGYIAKLKLKKKTEKKSDKALQKINDLNQEIKEINKTLIQITYYQSLYTDPNKVMTEEQKTEVNSFLKLTGWERFKSFFVSSSISNQNKLQMKKSKIEDKIMILQEKIKMVDPFQTDNQSNPEDDFFYLKDTHYSWKTDDKHYDYTFYPFDKVEQRDNNDRNTVTIGRWNDKQVTDGQELYINGKRCNNGPSREVLIKYKCHKTSKIVSVKETNFCIYELIFQTPGICEDIDDDFHDQQKKEAIESEIVSKNVISTKNNNSNSGLWKIVIIVALCVMAYFAYTYYNQKNDNNGLFQKKSLKNE